MTKYGFDYFVNRAAILQENSDILEEARGKPSPWRSEGSAGDIAADVFKQAVADMGKGGSIPVTDLTTGETNIEKVPGLGGNRPVNRALRYMIYILSKMDISDENQDETSIGEEEAKKEITDQATHLLGIPREGWTMLRDEVGNKRFGDPDKLYRAAIVAAIRKYADYIVTPEFKEKALKPENSVSYAHQNRLPTAASAIKAKKRGAHHGGMSAVDMDRIETSDREIRNLIHTALGADKRRKKSLLNPEEIEDDTSTFGGVSNTDIDNAYLITDALELLIDNGQDIKDRINSELGTKKFANREQAETALNSEISQIHGDYPNVSKDAIRSLFFADLNFLNDLYDQYTELHETGVDMDQFKQDVEAYKLGKPKSVGRIMDLWLHEIQELQFTADMFAKHMPDEPASGTAPKKTNEEFPGYPKVVTDKFLTTPEQKEQFKKWNNFRINNMMARQEKIADKIRSLKWGEGETAGELAQVRRGFEGFMSKRPELQAPKKGQPQQKKPTMKQKEEEAAFDADNYAPTDYDYPEEDEESSYIMGYMTEQIHKDKFKPKGEFKDRGFKKLSYHDWITKYQ